MNKKTLLIALFSVFAAGSALAQGAPGDMSSPPMSGGMHHMGPSGHGHRDSAKFAEWVFKKADTDKDGKITLDEAKTNAPRLAVIFDSIDTKHQGYITADDLKAFNQRMMEAGQQERAKHFDEMFKNLDKNGDGLLTKEEITGHKMLVRNFDKIDTNKDGKISKDELAAWMKMQWDKRGHRNDKHR